MRKIEQGAVGVKMSDNSDISELQKIVVCYLARRRGWGNASDIQQAMLNDFNNIKSGGDCSYQMDQGFEQSLFHFPNVISYMYSLPQSQHDCEDDLEWATRGVAGFLKVWQVNLHQSHLLEPIITTIQSVLCHWNHAFKVSNSSNEWALAVSYPPAARFLDAILQQKVPYQESAMFMYFFQAWCNDYSSAEASANLLSLFLFIRLCGGDAKLHRAPDVLKAAFDLSLCERHWENSRKLIAKQCPVCFIDVLKGTLLSIDAS